MKSPANPTNADKPRGEERRESFRCPVEGARQQGTLRSGSRDVAVRILDESTGGFAVEAFQDPGCQVGDSLLLEVALAWVEARVVGIQSLPAAPPDDHPKRDESTNADEPAVVRLSLARVRDVDDCEVDPEVLPILSWSRFRSGLRPLVPLGRSVKGTILMLVVILVVGGGVVWLLEQSVPMADAIRSGAQEAAARAPLPEPPFAPDDGPALKPPSRRVARSAPAAETRTAATAAPKIPEPARLPPTLKPRVVIPPPAIRLAHPGFLLRPDIDRLLDLSRNQREALRRLLAEHESQPEAIGEPTKDATSEGDALLQLGRKAVDVLNDEQKQSLLRLYAAMESLPASDAPQQPATPGGASPVDNATSRG